MKTNNNKPLGIISLQYVLIFLFFLSIQLVHAQDTVKYYADIDIFTLQGLQSIEGKGFKNKRFIARVETSDKVIFTVYKRGYEGYGCQYIFYKKDGYYVMENIGGVSDIDKKTILNIYIYILGDKVMYAIQNDNRNFINPIIPVYFGQCEILYPTYKESPKVILEVPPSPDLYKLYYEEVNKIYQADGVYDLYRKDFVIKNDSIVFTTNYNRTNKNKKTITTNKVKLDQISLFHIFGTFF